MTVDGLGDGLGELAELDRLVVVPAFAKRAQPRQRRKSEIS
jgi:hypothetical protein